MMKACSRCGLGQTSWRPVVTSLQNFRSHYESRVQDDPDGFQRSFDLNSSRGRNAERLTGRKSTHDFTAVSPAERQVSACLRRFP